MNSRLQRWLPFALAAWVIGVATGFAFGQAQTPPQGPATSAPSPVSVVDAPEEESAELSRKLACVGAPSRSVSYDHVVGVSDVGAESLARVLGVEAHLRSFTELAQPASREQMTAAALDAAEAGPIVLVVKRSEGTYQRTLAAQILEHSPESAIVVVTDTARVSRSHLTGFPDAAIAVPPPAANGKAAKSWAAALRDVVTGITDCSGG